MKTLNGSVAVEPIEFDHNKGKTEQVATRFMGSDKTMRTLVKAKVLFDSEKFSANQQVYLRADTASAGTFQKNKLIYKSADKEIEFILIPEAMVVGVDG